MNKHYQGIILWQIKKTSLTARIVKVTLVYQNTTCLLDPLMKKISL
jgi:hypothetical protein